MNRKTAIAMLILALAVTGPTPATGQPRESELVFASPDPDLKELVGISPVIFAGTVVGMRYGTHEGSDLPYTFVQFGGVKMLREDAELSSRQGNTLEISHIGGIRDEDMHFIDVSHQPSFDLGERYLVFLRGGGWRFNPVAGGRRGVFRLWGPIEEDPLVLDIDGQPIATFKDGRRVYSTPQEIGEEPEAQGSAREEPLTKEQLEQMDRRVDPALSPREVEAKEEELAARERERDVAQRPEYDSVVSFENRWNRVLKLSEFARQIEYFAEQTRGTYPRFERIYVQPVPPDERMEVQTPRGER